MRVTLWGTRGSLATPGPETVRYGGNTSCVEVCAADGTRLVLDAGTGIRRLGATLGPETGRVDLLLTHLHMDHIQGLGFFEPLFRPGLEVHIWGPSTTTLDLRAHLNRYLSPPLFPVRLRDLPCRLTLHDAVATPRFEIDGVSVESMLVSHPGATVGFRIEADGTSLAYIPDHEPALGSGQVPDHPAWISGLGISSLGGGGGGGGEGGGGLYAGAGGGKAELEGAAGDGGVEAAAIARSSSSGEAPPLGSMIPAETSP